MYFDAFICLNIWYSTHISQVDEVFNDRHFIWFGFLFWVWLSLFWLFRSLSLSLRWKSEKNSVTTGTTKMKSMRKTRRCRKKIAPITMAVDKHFFYDFTWFISNFNTHKHTNARLCAHFYRNGTENVVTLWMLLLQKLL